MLILTLGLGFILTATPVLAAPTISNIKIDAKTSDVTIKWQTSEPTTATLTFADHDAGNDPNYRPLTLQEIGGPKTDHNMLVVLVSGHTFTVTIVAKNSAGQSGTAEETFRVGGGTASAMPSSSPLPQPSGSLPKPTDCPTAPPTPGQFIDPKCIGEGIGSVPIGPGPDRPEELDTLRKASDPNVKAPAWFSQTLALIGEYELRGIDLIWWVTLLLLALSTILELFFFVKRRRLWGVVYDARTKQPLEMAVVRLFDQEHHKLLETRVTPRSGRYSFLADPGEYYLDVTKEGYHFPSRIVTAKIDNEYANVYHGEVIKLGAGQSLIAPDIPVDSESGEIKKTSPLRALYPLFDAIRLPLLLVASLALSVYIYYSIPSLLAQFLVGLVAILLAMEFFFIRKGRK